MKEAKKSEGVSSYVNPDFPNIFCVVQLLEIFRGNPIQFPNDFQHPGYFSSLFVRQNYPKTLSLDTYPMRFYRTRSVSSLKCIQICEHCQERIQGELWDSRERRVFETPSGPRSECRAGAQRSQGGRPANPLRRNGKLGPLWVCTRIPDYRSPIKKSPAFSSRVFSLIHKALRAR